jgi:molybdate transport system permease protein
VSTVAAAEGASSVRRALRRGGSALLAVPAALAVAFLVLPLVALVARAPWGRVPDLLLTEQVADALRLSLGSAALATGVCLVLGVPLAWLLTRAPRSVTGPLRALVMIPLVLPPVVGGVALLLLLGRRGLVGRHLDAWFGLGLPFTTTAVVVAEAFVALPFLVLAVEGAIRSADPRYSAAAATLGATPLTTFRRVTLPMAAPGVVAGAMLCFARALGEFGATITFAGSFPGVTRTMPLAVYVALESDPDAAIALSLVLLAASVLVLAGLRGRWIPAAGRS